MRTLAVTRPVGHGSDTASLIRKHGWTPLIFHTVELKPRPAQLVSDELKAIFSTGTPDWIVFMSPRGAALFFQVMQRSARSAEGIFSGSRVLAVGPKTEASLRQLGARNVETPNDYSSDGVADFFSGTRVNGKRIVLTRSSGADDLLEEHLVALGALTHTIRLYDSAIPADYHSTSKFLEGLK